MLKPNFTAACWSLVEPDGFEWGGFGYISENQPGATLENLPTGVVELSFSFEGLLYHYFDHRALGYYAHEIPRSFDRALGKYRLLKALFRALNCDELVGVDGNAASALNQRFDSSSQPYGGWCFRFAKEGTQVLIRCLEEGRVPPPDQGPEFICISANDIRQEP